MKRYSSLLAIVAGILLYSCGGKSEEKVTRIKPVKYEEVAFKGGLQKRTFTGVSQSGSETNLSFRTSGLITKLDVRVGDRVRKGSLLAQLDVKDIQLSFQQAKANVESARIQMENSKSNLERTKELYQSQSASLNDYENAKTVFANAQSGFETASKALDLQRSQFDYAKIVAPINGVISAVRAEVNENVQAGSPVIVIDKEDGKLEANLGIPEQFISQIENGDLAQVEINDQQLEGTVTEVGFSATGSAVFPVIVQLNGNIADLRPGMPASATFQFGSADAEQSLFVPIYAVGEDDQGNFVFLLESEDDEIAVAKKKHIQVGDLTNDGFRLISGLEEGQKIATAGLQTLLDGQKVKL